MKKFYSLVLMAAALLIGTNASAVDVASWAELQEAIATPNAEINLTASPTIPVGEHDFNGAVITCGNSSSSKIRLLITAAGEYTLRNVTLKNYKYTDQGAIYASSAASGVTLNIASTVSFVENTYDIDAYNSMTINNAATINKITLRRGGTINNDGVITSGVNVNSSGTVTVNNHVGASYTQSISVAKNLVINNVEGGTAKITGGTISGTLTATNVTISGGTRNVAFTGTDVTISGGTFKGAVNGTGFTVSGGTFNLAPTATGLINPGEFGYVKCPEGVGSLTVADGYAWRSYDKMVVRNDAGVVQVTRGGSSFTCLVEEAFVNAQNGDKITLIEDVISYASLWVGTAEKTGTPISLTLDLNGHTLSSAKNVTRTITLTHGALYIKNSVPGQGGIYHARSNTGNNSSEVIYIVGSPDRMKKNEEYINPRNAAVEDLFVYLLVDEGVTLSADGDFVNGITVIENAKSGNTLSQLNYYTTSYSDASSAFSVANGVRIDIKGTVDVTKYAGKINGNIRHPNEMIVAYPGQTDALIEDTANSTFIHVFPTAVMHTSNAVEATAVYSSGYGRWQIEGLCQGATGIYVKSGEVDITDATIESTYTGEASITTGKGSGINAGGNAIVIESNVHYTGQQAIVIGGDTKITTEADGGAAVVDVVDKNQQESKVENITINGGTFEGDYAIVISSKTASEDAVTVNGVTVTGGVEVGGSSAPEDVAEIMGDNTHTTVVENPDGTTTLVVSAGTAPAAATEWVDVAALASGSNAKWTGFTAGVITNGNTVKLGELQIISADGTTGKEKQQLTVENGAVLNVERLIMNDYARIIVETGGKLIVSGTQGINAPVAENIVLKASETSQAIFLFHPNVTSNRHPNATVEMYTSSHMLTASPWTYAYQRFAIPVQEGVAPTNDFSGTLFPGEEAYGFETYVYDWDGHKWNFCSSWSGLEPFKGYQLANNSKNGGVTYTFKGELVGNGDAEYNFPTGGFDFFGSSHLAPIYIDSLLKPYESTNMEASVWVYDYTIKNFAPITSEDIADGFGEVPTEIKPMDGFVLKINASSGKSGMNYASAIWGNPNFDAVLGRPSQKNPAPARNRANNTSNRAIINVMSENGNGDMVKLVEKDVYTAEFDNGSDASKLTSTEGINLSATTEVGELARVATDNLLGTVLSFRSCNSTEYTITLTNVLGEDYALRDNVTGQVIAFAEGATYTFMQDANTTVPARFEVIDAAKVPTAIDNVEEAAKANGIYTITGQYMGHDFTKVPAGVYIVNGIKVVK